MALGQSKGLSRAVVYGITITPLLATLGYFFLEHVPSREEYFLNLRFRTLAVIGKQIETKLEAVSSGLTYGRSMPRIDQAVADGAPRRLSLEEYVGRVFPGLQPPEGQAGVPKKPGAIELTYFPYTTPWRSVYRVSFPRVRADGRPTIPDDARWFGLRFAGAQGNQTLAWQVAAPPPPVEGLEKE